MSKNSDDLSIKLSIDPDLNAYQNFVPPHWHKDVMRHADRADMPELTKLLMILVLDWRSAGATMALPRTMIEHTKVYHDSFICTGKWKTQVERVSSALVTGLMRKIPEITADPKIQRALRGHLLNIEMETIRMPSNPEFSLNDAWNRYLGSDSHAHQLAIWGALRIGYVSVYNAYENFVIHVLKLLSDTQHLRTSKNQFREIYENILGSEALSETWDAEPIEWARCSRHALSHAGGKETSDLKRLKKKLNDKSLLFNVEDGSIQVWPKDAKKLFDVLSRAAKKIVFQATRYTKASRDAP